ncbi:MAG TPA: hypothetical protein DCL44_08560 [Elusimicrobia bacterium]|nr:hypothetical protein [Elusimicrobiota bacterium]
MNKLGEIITITLISSSVFVLLDSAKRNFRPETPVPAVNNAQIVQEIDPPVSVRVPKPNRAKAVNTGMRDAIRDNIVNIRTARNAGGRNDIAYINGSEGRKNPPVSDRAGYLMDVRSEKDIVVSRMFNNKAAGIKAMMATVNMLKSKDKPVLFASLMREAAGGFFYVIRIRPSAVKTTRVNPGNNRSEQLYINTMKGTAARIENECRNVLQDDR